MPLLSMSDDGEIYESDSTRSDGSGYGRGASQGEQGDVALTRPALWAEGQRQAARERLKRHNAAQRARAEMHKRVVQIAKARAKRVVAIESAQAEAKKAANMGQDPLLEAAVSQGHAGAHYETQGVTGNGLTSDGRHSSDALRGFGRSADFAIEQSVEAPEFDASSLIPVAEDFGRHNSMGAFLPSLSTFLQPAITSASQALATVTGATIQKAAGVQAPAPLPASTPVVQAPSGPTAAELMRKMDLERQMEEAEEKAKMKQYLMIGGAVVGVGIVALLVMRKR